MSQLHRNVTPTIVENAPTIVEVYQPQHPVLHLPAPVRMVVEDHLQNYTEDRSELEHAEGWFSKKIATHLKKGKKYLTKRKLDKLGETLAKQINNLGIKLNKENEKVHTNIKNLGIKLSEENKKVHTNIKNLGIKLSEENKKVHTEIKKLVDKAMRTHNITSVDIIEEKIKKHLNDYGKDVFKKVFP